MEHIYCIPVFTMGQIEFCKYPWQSCFTLCWAGWGETCILTIFIPSLENWICLSTNHYLHVSEVKSDKKSYTIVGLFGVWCLTLNYPWPTDEVWLWMLVTNYTNFEVWLWMLYHLLIALTWRSSWSEVALFMFDLIDTFGPVCIKVLSFDVGYSNSDWW